MILNRVFISYMARELAKRLGRESLEIRDPQPLRERFENVLIDELSLEDEINAEARELLNQYTDYMRRQRIPYQEMFAKVKRQVLAERKVTSAQAREPGGRKMKISRSKVLEFSHKLGAVVPRVPGIRAKVPWNDIRLHIVRELTDILTKEETIDQNAQKKSAARNATSPRAAKSGRCSTAATTTKKCSATGSIYRLSNSSLPGQRTATRATWRGERHEVRTGIFVRPK